MRLVAANGVVVTAVAAGGRNEGPVPGLTRPKQRKEQGSTWGATTSGGGSTVSVVSTDTPPPTPKKKKLEDLLKGVATNGCFLCSYFSTLVVYGKVVIFAPVGTWALHLQVPAYFQRRLP